MTRLAVGPADAPQLPPLFVTAGRAALAGLLSIVFLRVTGARWPSRRVWPALAVVRGRHGGRFSAVHRAGAAPCRCDACRRRHRPAAAGHRGRGGLRLRQRPSNGFWACAVLGTGLVLGFAALAGGGRLSAADGLLLLAMLCAAIGYVAGASASRELSAEQVICWVLVLSLPLTAAADVGQLAHAAGARRSVGRLRLCHGVFDVAGLLRLVPRPGAGWHGACQPGAVAAALSGAAVRGAGAGRATGSQRRCAFRWR